MWDIDIELLSLVLVASSFTHWAISLTHNFKGDEKIELKKDLMEPDSTCSRKFSWVFGHDENMLQIIKSIKYLTSLF